jgi:hypothetical protein
MSVESKIRDFLKKGKEIEESLQLAEEVNELEEKAAAENLKPNATPGDSTNPTQGSSNPSPEMQDLSGTGDKHGGLTSSIGKAAADKMSQSGELTNSGAGDAPNYETDEDPRKVVNQSSSKGNVNQEEVEESEEEVIAEDEAVEESEEVEVVSEEESIEDAEEEVEGESLFEGDIAGLFADEEHLSEDFKVKAAELFETVVTARLANEIEGIQAELAEEADAAQAKFQDDMVEKIDAYLNYVSENWMKENELAIERGIRTEITEDFIKSLKTVFTEHYIEVPEEKYDVLGEMQAQIEELKGKLNESIETQVSLTKEREDMLRDKIIGEASEDLTMTESEKLSSLLADVDFGDSELFAEKVSVVKENYFPKQGVDTAEVMSDTVEGEGLTESSSISKYAQAISKQIKK